MGLGAMPEPHSLERDAISLVLSPNFKTLFILCLLSLDPRGHNPSFSYQTLTRREKHPPKKAEQGSRRA